ncbi:MULTISPECIES: hypothetical protein [unclassified Candidatus Frackibacter]|nr:MULTISPECIES: hypothetical protein [unclassified Candidatus Frackibacter]SDC01506.1 hypothetical protein SAMN04515661_101286 [Candidatus Frackibacter sp. WG11]SFL37694.1 hypothetical protein SAMN04488699_101285 [Candidatus Frackibacter sp. WG13]
MRKFNVLVLTLLLILICSLTVLAQGQEIEFSGSLTNSLVGYTSDGQVVAREVFDLVLDKDFGFNAKITLDLEFESYHNGQEDIRNTEISTRKAYLDYYTKNMDWKIGKQNINWGHAYKINPTDYFTTYDLTSFKPLDEKLSVEALKGTYYTSRELEITGVVASYFKGTKSDRRMFDSIVDKLAGAVDKEGDLELVESDIKNTQLGLKITKRSFYDYDISLSTYHGRDKIPAIDTRNSSSNLAKFVFPQVNRLGIDIIGDLREVGIWTEIVYGNYIDDQFDSIIEAAVGADYKFENNLYLVGQGYYKEGRTELEEEIKAINSYMIKPVFKFHQIELNILYDINNEAYLIEPQFNYSLTNAIQLQFGGSIVEIGRDDNGTGIVSNLCQEDKIFIQSKVNF